MAETNPTRLIEERSLPISFRGYGRKATDALFEELKTAVSALASERDGIRARVEELESRLPSVEQREKEISEALVLASRVRAESEREGKVTADEKIRAAEAEAERILAQATSRARAFEQEARSAEQLAARAREQLTSFLESLLTEIERRGKDLGSAVNDLVKRAGESGRGESDKVKLLVEPPPEKTETQEP